MEPISNADRLVLLLRQKLQERAKAGRAANRQKAVPDSPAEPSALQALAAVESVDEGVLRRAFVQNLLADQLGPELLNDAQFQQIVSRVTEAIDDDEDASRLLSRLIAELRTP